MISKKIFGIVLIVISIILIALFVSIKTDFDSQGIFLCEAVSSNPSLTMAQCPAHTSPIPTFVMGGIVLSVLLLVAGLYLVFVKLPQTVPVTKKTFKKIDLSILSDEEQQIYTLLTENEGSVYQSELVKQTGLSKVKVTRLLDKLEHDDQIIERKRRGMTNIVVLK